MARRQNGTLRATLTIIGRRFRATPWRSLQGSLVSNLPRCLGPSHIDIIAFISPALTAATALAAIGGPTWALLEQRILIRSSCAASPLTWLRDRVFPLIAIPLLTWGSLLTRFVQDFVVSEEIARQVGQAEFLEFIRCGVAGRHQSNTPDRVRGQGGNRDSPALTHGENTMLAAITRSLDPLCF
jgi:hypothetical protein